MKFVIRFGSDIKIKYKLIDDPIVDFWAQEIVRFTIDDCCKINHFSGYTSKANIEAKITRLYELADIINQYVTDKIQISPISGTDHNTALSNLAIMHTHFPELHGDSAFEHLHPILTEYNDIIHWLEGVLHVLYSDTADTSAVLTINLDLNKASNIGRYEIPEESYNLFYPYINFGDLHLGYTQVGRHAFELFMAKDLHCPKDQFIPQSVVTGTAYMYFTNYFHDTEEQKQEYIDSWKSFYEMRGGIDFWGYAIDDPRLRFGVIKIGEIESISINENNYPIPKSIEELNTFRSILVENEVTDWEIE